MMGSWGVGRGKTTLTAPVWPHTQFISTLSTLGIDLSGSSWGLSLPPLPTRGPGHPGTPKRGLYLRAASNKNDGRDEEQPANGIVRVACEVGERRESNLGRFQLWPWGTPSCWLLHPSDMPCPSNQISLERAPL
ncbi:uncharacterized protein isoform X10 [Macaca fascicularis]|uniref:uncharacterized protein isoform X10 n=1 Tax=Macaca fascicularis TaxID=9541 RepID=UPI003D15C215